MRTLGQDQDPPSRAAACSVWIRAIRKAMAELEAEAQEKMEQELTRRKKGSQDKGKRKGYD